MVNVRIPDTLRDDIDELRGDVPRERWIRRALEREVYEAQLRKGFSERRTEET